MSTTTTTTAERTTTTTTATTTFSLPHVMRPNVRYEMNADHYWNAMELQFSARIERSTVLDRGHNLTAAVRALRAFGQSAGFFALNVPPNYVYNVFALADRVTDSTFAFSRNSSSCIKLADLRVLPNTMHQACLRDPKDCYYGFSVALWVKFTEEDLTGTTKTIMLASGPEAGFMLSQVGPDTLVEVRSGNQIWRSKAFDPEIRPDKWMNIGFIWSRSSGSWVCSYCQILFYPV